MIGLFSAIGESLKELLCVCAVAVLCDLICENSSSKGLYSALKIVCSLCVCCVMLSFVPTTAYRASEAFGVTYSQENHELSSDAFLELTKAELEKNMSETIYRKFGIKPHSLGIDFSKEETGDSCELYVKAASIILPKGTDSITATAIEAFIGETLACEKVETR